MLDKLLLYDNFNARYFSFKDVAESFVPNDEYVSLTKENSLLLMGSRGCGKTTLLKMLTPAGLNYWQDEEAKKVKENIKFTGVYIPSDIQWKNQFDYLSKHLIDQQEIVCVLVEFLFSCNVQIALCKTYKSMLDFDGADIREKINTEFQVCKSLIKVWKLDESILPTFDGIEVAILERVEKLNSQVKKLIFNDSTATFKSHLPEYIFSDFFDLVKLGSKVAEINFKLEDQHKWALCFDELEIVPKFIQLKLIKFLRSVDQKFLFKLTTTPILHIEDNVLDVTQGNDFNSVKLWVYDEVGLKRWGAFCEKLLLKKFRKKYNFDKDNLYEVFGNRTMDSIIKSELETLTKKDRSQIGYKGKFFPGTSKESSLYFMFKRLATTDPSFKELLIAKKIDPNEPYTNDELIKKSLFLKYKVDAMYRLIYKGRTRRKPAIHFGVPHIFDICDGNPRLVIGLINEILQNSDIDPNDIRKIPYNIQSSTTFSASEKYYNLLENHPDSTVEMYSSDFNLAADLINRIGSYMHSCVTRDEFHKNAPTTFLVDEDINAKIISLLETALHLGAIVYLDPVESLSNKGVLNKRFRLSGFLTPKFKIPNRTNSQVRLSTILSKTTNDKQVKIF